jgi:hypothetical protein
MVQLVLQFEHLVVRLLGLLAQIASLLANLSECNRCAISDFTPTPMTATDTGGIPSRGGFDDLKSSLALLNPSTYKRTHISTYVRTHTN